MFGKASIFLVLGFSVIFMIYTANILNTTGKTVDVFVQYYNESAASKIAQAAANLACSSFFQSVGTGTLWSAGYTNLSFGGGVINVIVTMPGSGNLVKLTCLGAYGVRGTTGFIEDTVIVTLQKSNFAKFGNFYNSVGGVYFATGDTCDGPIHFNTTCNVTGNPVFMGKVTCLNGISASGTSNPKFLGGYQSGVSVPLTVTNTAASMIAPASTAPGGKIFQGSGSTPYINVDLTFNSNGTVTYKTMLGSDTNQFSTKSKTYSWSDPTTEALSSFAPNGVVLVKQGNVNVHGILDGQITIAALDDASKSLKAGNIFITDDVVYKVDPRTNPTSNDLLGLVAESNVQLNYQKTAGDITIMGSLLAQRGSLIVENVDNYSSISNLKLFGGLVANSLAVTSNPSITRGYRYNQKYDERFMNTTPPYFPATGTYEVLSWLE